MHVGVVHWLFVHSWVALQGLPQSRMLPHPSEAGPHIRFKAWQVFGEQVDIPHTFGAPPPPQTCPDAQSPQWITPSQPSG